MKYFMTIPSTQTIISTTAPLIFRISPLMLLYILFLIFLPTLQHAGWVTSTIFTFVRLPLPMMSILLSRPSRFGTSKDVNTLSAFLSKGLLLIEYSVAYSSFHTRSGASKTPFLLQYFPHYFLSVFTPVLFNGFLWRSSGSKFLHCSSKFYSILYEYAH